MRAHKVSANCKANTIQTPQKVHIFMCPMQNFIPILEHQKFTK